MTTGLKIYHANYKETSHIKYWKNYYSNNLLNFKSFSLSDLIYDAAAKLNTMKTTDFFVRFSMIILNLIIKFSCKLNVIYSMNIFKGKSLIQFKKNKDM